MRESSHLQQLESRVSELIEHYRALKARYDALHAEHAKLAADRQRLIEYNRMAREKIEHMIERLRAMESTDD